MYGAGRSGYPIDKQLEAIERLRSELAEEHLPLLRLLQDRHFADVKWPELDSASDPVWRVLGQPILSR